ncbi:hypothetical protein AWW66_11580 [Micromonospora rosaria]|uniref:Peptidase M48 domain-containing protein n=1 Tax=Micromonospora rosaria TaxID=47874 RepID=A0A136PTR6_9ACTN|nr:hypothetical protein [Micromonospora rosaria]KXK61818.1 hypothetical protein AWW66_11580 [Micromonospora rosaria]
MVDDDLPGGLGVWRARWLVLRHGGTLGPVVYGAGAVALAPLFLLWLAVLALVDQVTARWGSRDGVPVAPETHPELSALVTEVARHLGTDPPDRVLLSAEPVVEAEVTHGQRYLRIGLPVLACLSRADLRAVLGHRLALLRHRRAGLVVPLVAIWMDAVRDSADETGRKLRRATRLRRELDAFAAQVQRDADAAAATVAGGGGPAARATALAHVVAQTYLDDFLDLLGVPERTLWRRGVGVRDLDDGWRRVVHRGLGESDWDEETAELLATIHPGLAGPVRALGTTPLSVRPSPDPVPVPPLTPRQQRRLVRRLLGIPFPESLRWTTFAEAPHAWWRRRATRDADSVRADVATVLGREPVDDLEVYQVVRTRTREVLAAAFDIPLADLADEQPYDDDDPPGALVFLVEDALLRRGWRLEHPAVRGVLVDPAGDRVDARQVLVAAAGDPSALRHWLTAGPSA